MNNAGIGALGRFAESSPERLRQIMELNFFAAAETDSTGLAAAQAGATPIVVNVGSILGHRGIPRSSEYCASKFALRGLSESLRAELAPLGIDLLVGQPGHDQDRFLRARDQSDQPVNWPRSWPCRPKPSPAAP